MNRLAAVILLLLWAHLLVRICATIHLYILVIIIMWLVDEKMEGIGK